MAVGAEGEEIQVVVGAVGDAEGYQVVEFHIWLAGGGDERLFAAALAAERAVFSAGAHVIGLEQVHQLGAALAVLRRGHRRRGGELFDALKQTGGALRAVAGQGRLAVRVLDGEVGAVIACAQRGEGLLQLAAHGGRAAYAERAEKAAEGGGGVGRDGLEPLA